MSGRLQGQLILNTRPAHQQQGLNALLDAAGAQLLSFPAIAIEAVAPSATHRRLAASIADYDLLLFVSRNAVDGAFRLFGDAALPGRLRYAVIGAATRDALIERLGEPGAGLVADEPYNSEALLAAAELQRVDGQRILIFRGQSGRNLLGDELARRGATVEYCEVYRRTLPEIATDTFARLVASGFPTLAVLTSDAGMHNLMRLVDAASRVRLCAIPWLLISERMRESARELGHNADIIIAQSASDSGICQTICAWADRQIT